MKITKFLLLFVMVGEHWLLNTKLMGFDLTLISLAGPGSLAAIVFLAVSYRLLFLNILQNVPEIPLCCAVQDMMYTIYTHQDPKSHWKMSAPAGGLSNLETFPFSIQVPLKHSFSHISPSF